MKKRILLAICILAVSFVSAFASEIVADSRISEVTVYPQAALITRSAKLQLDPGLQDIIFKNIVSDIDEDSLRVSAIDADEVRILGAKVKKEFLKEEASARVKELQANIQKLEDSFKMLQNNKNILADEKKFLDSIRLFSGKQVPKDLVTRMPAAKELDDTLKFLDVKLKENYAQALEIDLKAREISKDLDVLRRELSDITGPLKKVKRSIVVEIDVKKRADIVLRVAYLVKGAWWQPIYDARANFDKASVEFISYGIIKQSTGEDWQDVDIYLSTAKPAVGGRMPKVDPWILRPYQPPMPMARAKAEYKGRYQTMAFQGAGATMSANSLGVAEAPVYSQPEEKGVAVVYKLTRRVTVKSDGSEHKLPVSMQALKADFEYSAYPRALPSSFLGSRVTNAPNLQLLSGKVNVFLDNDFVGVSNIDNIGPGEEFDLYLGRDENVKVKREMLEKKVDETLMAGIPAPNRKIVFKYKLSVENYKSKNIKVKLFEAMPVSEDDRIKIKITQNSLEPKVKDWQDRRGVWLWELDLEPKVKKEILYTYIVEYPRNMQVEGL